MPFSLFNRVDPDGAWRLENVERPWPSDQLSIRDFLRSRASSDGLLDPELGLPDDDRLASMKSLRFIPGLFDRMMLSHDDAADAQEQASGVVNAVRDLCRQSKKSHLLGIHVAAVSERMSDALPFVEHLVDTENWTKPARLRAVARLLIAESPQRDEVKVGLVCLRRAGPEASDLDLVLEVGRHGEFTDLACRAISGTVPGWERAVWHMARAMPGWGRSAAIQHLEGVEDAEIRDWLLHDGWRDSSYITAGAFVCATAGGLAGGLDTNEISLQDAGGLLEQLVHAEIQDARGLRQLPDGAALVEHYVERLRVTPRALWQHETARLLGMHASRRFGRWEENPADGWTSHQRDRISAACQEILDFDGWEQMAREAIASADQDLVAEGLSVAWALQLPLWDFWWNKATSDPKFEDWWRLAREVTEARLEPFLGLVGTRMDLAALGSGPEADAPMFGPPWKTANDLDSIVGALRRFPGRGWEFIRASLNSPMTRNRIWATRALMSWGVDAWPAEVRPELERLTGVEPDNEQRERLRAALRGDPDDTPPDPLAALDGEVDS